MTQSGRCAYQNPNKYFRNNRDFAFLQGITRVYRFNLCHPCAKNQNLMVTPKPIPKLCGKVSTTLFFVMGEIAVL